MTQQYRLASMVPGFSPQAFPTSIFSFTSPRSVSPHEVNSSPHLGITPQSLNSSSQPLGLPGDLCLYLGYVWLWQGLSDSHSFRLPQVSCFTLCLKCFSSDSDNCLNVGIGRLLQFPQPPRAGPVLLTLLVFPYSCFSFVLQFHLVLYILFP